jgi:sporulation protein YlmC with PRC-barrel domain
LVEENMGDQSDVMEWRGFEVIDRDGDKVGKLDEVYLDRESGQPEWAVVNTGLFGRKSSFVPIREAMREGDMIRVPYEKDRIKDAPNVEPDGEVSQEEELRIYEHYGVEYAQLRSGTDSVSDSGQAAEPSSGQTAVEGSHTLRLQRYVHEEIRNRKTRGDGTTVVRDEPVTTDGEDS